MSTRFIAAGWTTLGLAALLAGCTANPAPDVAGRIRDSLKQSGLNSVTVSQDRVKGVVTLGGTVQQAQDKARAEQVAQPLTQGQVLADEIAIVPQGADAGQTRSMYSDLDKGIQDNLDAALIRANIKGVTHSTKNGVVTLKGDLETPQMREEVSQVAAQVPNVQQVVNEIDVKNQRATTTSADRRQ